MAVTRIMKPLDRNLNIALAIVIPLTIAMVFWNIHDLSRLRNDLPCQKEIPAARESDALSASPPTEAHFYCRTCGNGRVINVWLHPQL